jgi:hypothetical protein
MMKKISATMIALFFSTSGVQALEPDSSEEILLLSALIDTFEDLDREIMCPALPNSPSASAFGEVRRDGVILDPPKIFLVPEGFDLIVTSFQWFTGITNSGSISGDGAHHVGSILASVQVPGTKSFVPVAGTVAPAGNADALGTSGSSIVMPTGMVIPPNAHLCLQIGSSDSPVDARVVGYIQGYLTKWKK